MGYAGYQTSRDPAAEGGRVTGIDPRGAADLAGLQVGDSVIAVDGVPSTDLHALDRAVLDRAPGDTVSIIVRRPGLAAPITLALVYGSAAASPFFVQLTLLTSIVGLLFLAVAAAVVLLRPRDTSARLFMLSGGCAAAGYSLFAVRALIPFGYWDELAGIAAVLWNCTYAAGLHLFLVFPAPNPIFSRIASISSIWRIGMATLLYGAPLALYAWDALGGGAPAHVAFSMFPPAVLLVLVIAIVHSYVRPAHPLARAQLKWILAALALGLGMKLWEVTARLSGGHIVDQPRWLNPIVWTLTPLSIGLAILRYRLFDVDRVIRAGISYGVLTLALVLGYVGTIYVVSRVGLALTGTDAAASPTVSVLAALAMAAVAQPVRRRLQGAIDRLIYRDRLARQRFLAEAVETLGQAQPPETVTAFLTQRAEERLGVTGAWLITPTTRDAPGPVTPLLERLHNLGRPALLTSEHVTAGHLESLPASDAALVQWYAAGARLLVPLRARTDGELAGIWALGGLRSGDLPDADDIAAVMRAGRQAAVLLEHARLGEQQVKQELLRHELEQARDVQELLLPSTLPAWPGRLEMAVRYRPAREMSGDFYDVFALERLAQVTRPALAHSTAARIGPPSNDVEAGAVDTTAEAETATLVISVGDVVGKGVGSALVMALARTGLRAAVKLGGETSPAAMLRQVGAMLHEDVGRKSFVACATAVIEADGQTQGSASGATDVAGRGTPHGGAPRLRVANAAQVPPLLCRRGTAQELQPPGDRLPLGIMERPAYQEATLDLDAGDVVVFASDGLPEAPSLADGQLYGFGRLTESAAHWSMRGADAEAIAAGIWADVTVWCGEESHHDDMTLLVLRVPYKSAQAAS